MNAGAPLRRPLVFEQDRNSFVARPAGGSMRVEPKQMVAGGGAYRLEWKGAEDTSLVGVEATGGVSNYASGGTRQGWRSGIPHFRKVRAAGLYRGIDAIYYARESSIEFDLIVHPGGKLTAVRLTPSAGRFLLNTRGDAELHTPDGTIRYQAPVAFQEAEGGRREPVSCAWGVNPDGSLRLDSGAYDTTRDLIVDPVLDMLTYFGGDGRDFIQASGVDADGNLVLAGDSLVAMDPETGEILQTVPLGGAPGRLALTSDGTTLYTVLEGEGTVKRLDAESLAVSSEFRFRPSVADARYGYARVGLAIRPGAQLTIGLYYAPEVSLSTHRLAVFDNGVKRTTEIWVSDGYDSLLFSPGGEYLFVGAFANFNSPQTVLRYAVDSSGLPDAKATSAVGGGVLEILGELCTHRAAP